MNARKQRLFSDLSRLERGAGYDLDRLELGQLDELYALLISRKERGLEGLSEGELTELEYLLWAASALPAREAGLA
jgi:hypothetical protein